MTKLYVVEFTDKTSGEQFLKIGMTRHYDVMERFTEAESLNFGRPQDQYAPYHIRVLASAYHQNKDEVVYHEDLLKKMYPKNFWTEHSFSGITECVKLNPIERHELIGHVFRLQQKWVTERQRKALNNTNDQ